MQIQNVSPDKDKNKVLVDRPDRDSFRDGTRVNIVYAHLNTDECRAYHRGNSTIVWSPLPLEGFDAHAYIDAYSFRGRMPGINALIMLEPVVVLPGEYSEEVWEHFDHVFTMCDALVGTDRKFVKLYYPRNNSLIAYPVTEDMEERSAKYPLKDRRQALCMINGNKESSVPGELYSARYEAAKWFYHNSRLPFDIYGQPPFSLPNYKGSLKQNEKMPTLARYRYCLCFENTDHPVLSRGYITEKILDCLETRTVPIYLGASNIEEYIPEGCFIDYRKFDSLKELNHYLEHLTDAGYESNVRNIDEWISKGGLRPYSCFDMYDNLIKTCENNPPEDSLDLSGINSRWEAGMSSGSESRTFSVSQGRPLWSFDDLSQTSSSLHQDEGGKDGPAHRNAAGKNARLAEELQKKGDLAGAIDSIKAALQDEPDNAAHIYHYAHLLLLTDRTDEGMTQLKRVIEVNPAHSDAHDDLGVLYFQKKDPGQALEHLLTAVHLSRTNYNAIRNLMSLLVHLERYDDAIATFKGLLTGSPDDPELIKIAEQFLPIFKENASPGSLENNGERIEIVYDENINFDDLDLYQRSHYRRYEFASSLVTAREVCGDFACGTGYGSVMLARKSQRVFAADINETVIEAIRTRYAQVENVEFLCTDILDLSYEAVFDTIVSFETVEHLEERDIPRLYKVFHKALKPQGRLIFSTPFMQPQSQIAVEMGFHHTFDIDERKIEKWLAEAGFQVEFYRYQNYATHTVSDYLLQKDFVICVARKNGTTLTPFRTRQSLEQENEALKKERELLRQRLSTIETEIGKYLLLPKQGLAFAEDLLFTYHNADFTKDPLFMETYSLVKKVDNGHLLKDADIRWRIHVLCWAANHARHLEGDFVDCGVSSGLYARGVMHFIDFQKLAKRYYLLDTFCGLDPKYSSPKEMQRNNDIGYALNEAAYQKVVDTFAGFNVKIIKGPVPETLPMVDTDKVCYLSIDMNCVLPEKAALDFFWDRMVSGGIIIIDDYGYPGHVEQKEAHDAFAKSHDVLVLSLPTCQGLIVKP